MKHSNPYLFYYEQSLFYYNQYLAYSYMCQKLKEREGIYSSKSELDTHKKTLTIKPSDVFDYGSEGVLIKGDGAKFFKDLFINVNESAKWNGGCEIVFNPITGKPELKCGISISGGGDL